MSFTESPICTNRANCYQCRNNDRFREQMEKQHGKFECPEGLPIGCELEKLPQKSQDSHKRQLEMEKEREEKIRNIRTALDELEMVSSPEGKKLVGEIRSYIMPDSKTPDKCKYGGKDIGEVDQECCGGKINKVKAFDCGKHTITTLRKCMGCKDYETK